VNNTILYSPYISSRAVPLARPIILPIKKTSLLESSITTAMATPTAAEPAVELAQRPRQPRFQSSRSTRSSKQRIHKSNEKHSVSSEVIRDVIIGFADGLTVPFALTAGLSSLGSNKLVIIGGLAELFSGAISMGLGAYLAAVTDRDHYMSEEKRERDEVLTKPDAEKEEIYEILNGYGVSREASKAVVGDLLKDEENWIRASHFRTGYL